ncbi:MAG: DUF4339 domain-containing protein [Akkermansiaceae bacterium]
MNTSPNSSWFYAESNEKKGPIAFSMLQQHFQEGLPENTLVWTEGMDQWIAASSVPGLSSNPYVAPSSEVIEAAESDGYSLEFPPQPIKLDMGFCIGQGWKYTIANFGQIFLFGLCYFFASMISSAILGVIAIAIDGPPQTIPMEGMPSIQMNQGGLGSNITSLLEQIISIFLTLGAIRYGHRLLNGEKPPVSDLFSQGDKLLSGVAATILYVLMIIIGLILLIIPGIIVALRCGLYQQAIVEKNLGPIEALQYSWNLTRINGFNLFCLYFLCFFVVIAGLLAVLIGLLWALPTVWLAGLIAFRFLHSGTACIEVRP